jgi:hypothetical protein
LLDVRQSNPTRGIVASIVNSATSSQTGAQLRITQGGIEDWVVGQPAATNAFSIWSGRSSSSDGTERMRIDSSGNVGIGTSSPGTGADSGTLAVRQNNATAGISIYRAALAPSRLALYDDNNSASIGTNSAGALTFNTNSVSTERARIDGSGNLLVAKTTTADTTVGAAMLSTGRVTSTMASSTSGDSTLHVYSTGASAYRFYVNMAGTILATSTTITAISDQRLKENVRDLDDGLNAVMALKPRKFDWKEGKGKDIKGDRGWIAQEFEQVFPDMVGTWLDEPPEGEEPYKAVGADLIPVLVKALQEQQQMIETLQAKVAALEAK